MITVDELQAQRDAAFLQQLAAVEVEIDAQISLANSTGTRTTTWTTGTSTQLTQAQSVWLAERYESGGYTVGYYNQVSLTLSW